MRIRVQAARAKQHLVSGALSTTYGLGAHDGYTDDGGTAQRHRGAEHRTALYSVVASAVAV